MPTRSPALDRRAFLATTAAAALAAAAPALAQGKPAAPPEDARLRGLLDRFFNELVDDSPERATSLGMDKAARAPLKGRLDDASLQAKARRLDDARRRLAALKAIDRSKLSDAGKVDFDVVAYQHENAVRNGDRYVFGDVGGNFSPYVISQRTGAYQEIPDFLDNQHRVETAADAEAYLARLRAFAVVMDQDLERMTRDVAAGVVPPDFACDLTAGQLRALRESPADQTVMVSSLVGKARKAGLTVDYGAQAAKIVTAEVFPALDRTLAVVAAARARATPQAGVWKLPDGAGYYADAVKASTTTNLTPKEVHEMGRSQVAEISARIDTILKGRGLTQGTVAERLTALGNDPAQLYPNTDAGRAELIGRLNEQIAALYKDLPRAFNTMPKAKVEVRRVPPFIQDGASNGYYQRAALDGSRPALYFINLKDTHDWPKFGLPTLTYHEAVPGHHLQISLAQESDQIPILRRTFSFFSACTEGWALYAEQLADEMSAYADDPLGRAGYLQSLLFRAARLVIDTGIHDLRWSRETATRYMVETTGFPQPRSQREVERYCVSPGQALSYKVGHTQWVKVREDAKAKLGPSFDLKAYHDAALLSGAMPLTVLERHIADWAARRAGG